MDKTLSELLDSSLFICPSCEQPFKTSKILPCLDSICESCLSKTINGNEKATCPVCLEKFSTKHIQNNLFAAHLADLAECKSTKDKQCDYCRFDGQNVIAETWCLHCMDSLCSACSDAHRKTKVTRDHKLAPYAEIRKSRYDHDLREFQEAYCMKHPNAVVTSYCEHCAETVCQDCLIRDHATHPHQSLQKAAEKSKRQLEVLMSSLQSKVPTIESTLQEVQGYVDEINEQEKKCEQQIHKQSDMLHKMVDEQKDTLINHLKTKTTNETERITQTLHGLQSNIKTLTKNTEFLNALRYHGKNDELLAIQKSVVDRLTKLVYLKAEGVKDKMTVNFSPGNASVKNVELVFGKLTSNSTPKLATTRQYKTSSVSNGVAERSPSPPEMSLPSNIHLPSLSGRPDVCQAFDAMSTLDLRDVWPTGLAITPLGQYIIVDRENKRVKIYDDNGIPRRDFTGSGKSSLGCPFDVAVLLNGDLALTDYESENVKIFSIDGKFKWSIDGFFKYPRGICVNSKGQIIVVDSGALQVTIHDPTSGRLISTIKGKDEDGLDYFTDPYYVTTTNEDNIVVTDWAAPNIKVFSPKGQLLAKYGTYGIKHDQVLQPYGVCTDAFGYIFVADNQNHRIHLLLPDGRFYKFLLNKMDGLWYPMALAINREGHLVVTEGLGKIKVFKYM